MKVLVLNCGSSTVKFQLIDTDASLMERDQDRPLAKGAVEKIGTAEALVHYHLVGRDPSVRVQEVLDHRSAISHCLTALTTGETSAIPDKENIDAVGHRVVHGGESFRGSVLIDPEVVSRIQDCTDLAPLHNPHNLKGYQVCRKLLPGVPQVAVFDTAFHQTMPPCAYLYGLPYVIYRRHLVRRFGFHGISHRYVAYRFRRIFSLEPAEANLITCHLGNGASVCAIEGGRSVDTSMGFTPLEGLVMGSRCGDLDPAAILHIMAKEGLSIHEAATLMNKHSGLYGISGVSADMRELLEEQQAGNARASLAISLFCYRLRKYIASYCGVLGRVDGLIFTGGIGENAASIRALSCERLDFFGIELDPTRNESPSLRDGLISTAGSPTRVCVIPTNEELLIARDTVRTLLNLTHPARS